MVMLGSASQSLMSGAWPASGTRATCLMPCYLKQRVERAWPGLARLGVGVMLGLFTPRDSLCFRLRSHLKSSSQTIGLLHSKEGFIPKAQRVAGVMARIGRDAVVKSKTGPSGYLQLERYASIRFGIHLSLHGRLMKWVNKSVKLLWQRLSLHSIAAMWIASLNTLPTMVFSQPRRGPVKEGIELKGKKAIGDFLRERFSYIPDMYWHPQYRFVSACGQYGVSYWVVTGTNQRNGSQTRTQRLRYFSFSKRKAHP